MHITKTAIYTVENAGELHLAAGSTIQPVHSDYAIVRSLSPVHDERAMMDAGGEVDFVEDEYTFDYPAIETALREIGATKEEASDCTDVLHIEGWGGREYEMPVGIHARDFTRQELERALSLVRERKGEINMAQISYYRVFFDEGPVTGTLKETFTSLAAAKARAKMATDGKYCVYAVYDNGDELVVATGRGKA